MTKRAGEYDAVKKTIDLYIAGTFESDVGMLKQAFHEKATLTGYIHVPNSPPEGVLMVAPIDALYGTLNVDTSPKAQGSAYAARIGAIEVVGDLAHVVVYEDDLMGENWINHLQLHRRGHGWTIVTKSFTTGAS